MSVVYIKAGKVIPCRLKIYAKINWFKNNFVLFISVFFDKLVNLFVWIKQLADGMVMVDGINQQGNILA